MLNCSTVNSVCLLLIKHSSCSSVYRGHGSHFILTFIHLQDKKKRKENKKEHNPPTQQKSYVSSSGIHLWLSGSDVLQGVSCLLPSFLSSYPRSTSSMWRSASSILLQLHSSYELFISSWWRFPSCLLHFPAVYFLPVDVCFLHPAFYPDSISFFLLHSSYLLFISSWSSFPAVFLSCTLPLEELS